MTDAKTRQIPANPHEQTLSATVAPRLTDTLVKIIGERLDQGVYRSGARLPSENALCAEFRVSRTVVREAVASLRQSGRLISKPGVGVFVVEASVAPVALAPGPAGDSRRGLYIMELRMAIEVEAAGLAAERRTPEDLADIVKAFDAFALADTSHDATIAADIDFHFAIARASHNPHFANILAASIDEVSADLAYKHGGKPEQALADYRKRTVREHGAILSAVSRRDTSAARTAMTRHLSDSIARYRQLLARAG